MWTRAELVALIGARNVLDKLIDKREVALKSPTEWSEPPFKPEKPKKNETHLEMMQRRNRDLVRAGKAVSSNLLPADRERVVRPIRLGMRAGYRPHRERRPEQLQSNGFWSWWR
jgi:hypothetical protein